VKIQRFFQADEVKLTSPSTFDARKERVSILLDESLQILSKNSEKLDKQLLGDLDLNSTQIAAGDFRAAKSGDHCHSKGCVGKLEETRGIEVGHIFYLGTKYSAPLNSRFKSSSGDSKVTEMGCYGLGVGRILASLIEVSHDQHGLIWPRVLAPYEIIVIPVGSKDETSIHETAGQICNSLENIGFANEVVFDDRDEQAGFKMNEARFLGFPFVIIVGKSWKQEGKLELQTRKTNEKSKLSLEELVEFFKKAKENKI